MCSRADEMARLNDVSSSTEHDGGAPISRCSSGYKTCTVISAQGQWTDERRRHGASEHPGQPSLLACLWAAYGPAYIQLGVIKLFSDALNFAGPLLLNAIVRCDYSRVFQQPSILWAHGLAAA